MNKVIYIVIILVTTALTASSQVRFGLRGGITVGELRFDRDVIDSDNRIGYTGGLLLDANIPVVGLGIEASAMYTHRDNRLTDHDHVFKRHYFEFPVYARYRLSIPALDRLLTPYLFTGPSFSVLFDENQHTSDASNKTYLSWDVGGGVDLFRHLRVSAAYGIGITKALEYVDKEYDGRQVNGKDRYWTLNAAWIF
ncbi:MAG: PorT family protein [Muribaculaceae bacterium]|nr:PorT family protein [Muribaculaceae bacterium]